MSGLLLFLGNICSANTLWVGVKVSEKDVSKDVLCLDKNSAFALRTQVFMITPINDAQFNCCTIDFQENIGSF